MAKLIINRPTRTIGMIRKMKIEIDGVSSGKIENGGTLELEIPAGEHELLCKVGILERSKSLKLKVDNDEIKHIKLSFNKQYGPLVLFFCIAMMLLTVFANYMDRPLNFQEKLLLYLVPVAIYLLLTYKNAVSVEVTAP